MKTNLQKRLCIFVGALLMGCFAQASTITANFTDGNGNTSYDQFPGIGGGGWLSAWTVKSGGSGYTTTSTSTVITSTDGGYTQVNSGGNYLHVTIQGTSDGSNSTTIGTGIGAVYRQHDASVVNLSQALVYNFDYRVDNLPNSTYVNIFSALTASAGTSGANQTWAISGGSGIWTFANGNLGGSTTPVNSASGTFSVNTTYHITIYVNPAAQSWSATITNLSDNSVISSGTLLFRYNLTADNSYLEFGAGDNTSSTSDYVAFSVDNISIASIPEPSVVLLVLVGSMMVFFFGKHRFFAIQNG